MMYNDGITIGGKHSFDDFGLVIAEREIGAPPKNSIRKTVPYMNGFYDFTKLYGSPSWGARTIKYAFDVIGVTVEEMEAGRLPVVNWLCNVHDEDIYDDAIPEYHFHGSFDNLSVAEDGEKVTLTFTFVCYPFLIKNIAHVLTFYEGGEVAVTNNGQPVSPWISTDQVCALSIGDAQKSFPPVADYRAGMMLGSGRNVLRVTKANELVYPYINSTTTNNGITFTDNGDGTITANGTATDVAWCWLRGSSEVFKLPVGKHMASGCPANVGANNYRIQYYVYNGTAEEAKYYYDFGSGVVIDVTENTQYISAAIRVVSGYKAENVVFDPKVFGKTVISFAEEVL